MPYETDKGFWDTKWCALADLLEQEQLDHDDLKEKVEEWLEAEQTARESLFELATAA